MGISDEEVWVRASKHSSITPKKRNTKLTISWNELKSRTIYTRKKKRNWLQFHQRAKHEKKKKIGQIFFSPTEQQVAQETRVGLQKQKNVLKLHTFFSL